MARFSDSEQTEIPGRSNQGVIKKPPDLRDNRECWCGIERYVTSPMPRDGILRNAVASRYGAIRYPSLKIGLDFMALGMPADSAVSRHSINLPGSQNFAQHACTRQAVARVLRPPS
jgi:hypothetical protein